MKFKTICLTIQLMSITNSLFFRNLGKFFGGNSNLFKQNHSFRILGIDFGNAIKNCETCLGEPLNERSDCLYGLKRDMDTFCEDYGDGRSLRKVSCNYFAKKNYKIAEELEIFDFGRGRRRYDDDGNLRAAPGGGVLAGPAGAGPVVTTPAKVQLGIPIRIQHDGSQKCLCNDPHFSLQLNCEDSKTLFRLIKLANGKFVIRDNEGKCMSKLRMWVSCLAKIEDDTTSSIKFFVAPNGEYFTVRDEDGKYLEINVHSTELEFGQDGGNEAKMNFLIGAV